MSRMDVRGGVVLALLCAWWHGAALAELGGAPQAGAVSASSSSGVAARQMKAAPLSGPYQTSVWHEATGTEITEWMNPQQQVFAVRWRGPLLPDLQALLGRYFGAYEDALTQKRAAGQRGGVVLVQRAGVVVVSRGRMGQFEGHAYAPELVPAGVDVEDLLP